MWILFIFFFMQKVVASEHTSDAEQNKKGKVPSLFSLCVNCLGDSKLLGQALDDLERFYGTKERVLKYCRDDRPKYIDTIKESHPILYNTVVSWINEESEWQVVADESIKAFAKKDKKNERYNVTSRKGTYRVTLSTQPDCADFLERKKPLKITLFFKEESFEKQIFSLETCESYELNRGWNAWFDEEEKRFFVHQQGKITWYDLEGSCCTISGFTDLLPYNYNSKNLLQGANFKIFNCYFDRACAEAYVLDYREYPVLKHTTLQGRNLEERIQFWKGMFVATDIMLIKNKLIRSTIGFFLPAQVHFPFSQHPDAKYNLASELYQDALPRICGGLPEPNFKLTFDKNDDVQDFYFEDNMLIVRVFNIETKETTVCKKEIIPLVEDRRELLNFKIEQKMRMPMRDKLNELIKNQRSHPILDGLIRMYGAPTLLKSEKSIDVKNFNKKSIISLCNIL